MRLHAGLGAIFGPDSGWAWGLSIVFLVMIIRLCLVPLFVKQVNAQRKMAQHAPQLQELRKKYKNDRQRLNEETMKYYKENGVNPLSGCLPMIPQLIIFFSLFSVLRFIADWKPGHPLQYGFTESVVESAQKTTIFGVHLYDKLLFRTAGSPPLSLHVVIVIVLTVVLSATTTFMTVRQSAKRGLMQTNVDPTNPMAQSQKFMQYIVPFFALSGLYWAFGLVLYWVTTNVWTLGQQWVLFKRYPAPVPGAAPAGGGTAAPAPAGPARAKPSAVSRLTSAKSVAPKPSAAAKPPASAKPAGAARPASATGSAAAKPSAAKPSAAKPSAAAKSSASASASASAKGGAAGQASRKKTQAGSPPSRGSRPASTSGQETSANGSGTGSGLLRRLGRKAPEPEPEPETPEVKLVRQQRVRQSRSKRSGKR
jgi:YidC/Oxa1 family membrane protein insertase